MLANLSFNELYEEVSLDYINDKQSTILTLLVRKNKIGSTQIHKLLFLTFAEGKVILPFSFAKWSHGPFSKDLQASLEQMKEQGLLQISKEKIHDYDKNSWSLSEEGYKFLENNKQKVLLIEKLTEKVLKEHDEGAISLENYCYKTYFLRQKNQTISEWRALIKNKISDLRALLHDRKKKIEDFDEIEETKKVLILSSFDYIESLLEKIFSREDIDEVVQGVLIKNSENYINLWGEVLRLTKDGSLEDIKKLLSEIRKTFRFINEVAVRYSVFESIFDSQEN